MNSTPKKAIIKKNNLQPNNCNPYQILLQNKFFHVAVFCAALTLNLIIIYLFRNNYNNDDEYKKLSQLHLTTIFSGMFLGGVVLGLKKGALGISLGIFLGATLGMWLSLLTDGKIISGMII
ncbi:putative membrane protein [Candidatus Phytoplasma solani]|uniref:hypothetical protein n=1 Tax=Candidatus Phytoplasma solani TaxID=69896 RepID=UPI0032D9E0E1